MDAQARRTGIMAALVVFGVAGLLALIIAIASGGCGGRDEFGTSQKMNLENLKIPHDPGPDREKEIRRNRDKQRQVGEP